MSPAVRRLLGPAAVLVVGGALIFLLARALLADAAEAELAERCSELAIGDSADEVFSHLGLHGYRAGCGSITPCQRVDLGGHESIPWLCMPDDCSLLWRVGAVGCFVDLDPETLVVREVVPMDHSDVAD